MFYFVICPQWATPPQTIAQLVPFVPVTSSPPWTFTSASLTPGSWSPFPSDHLQEAFLSYTTKTCGASFQLISLLSTSARPDSYYSQFWLNLTFFTYLRILKLQVFNFSLCLISVWQVLLILDMLTLSPISTFSRSLLHFSPHPSPPLG